MTCRRSKRELLLWQHSREPVVDAIELADMLGLRARVGMMARMLMGELARRCDGGVPRVQVGDSLRCCRCFARVGEHDSQCRRGHALVVRETPALEVALEMSVETKLASNDA